MSFPLYVMRSSIHLNAKKAALFLDRDGVLLSLSEKKYTENVKEMAWIDGSINALKLLATLNIPIIVVTNQQCIGLGETTRENVEEIHRKMNSDCIFSIDQFYCCPHLAQANCNCRKPKTGMFQEAVKDFSISPGKSIMVGDSDSDILAAKIMGIMPIHVKSGLCKTSLSHVVSFDDLMQSVPFIMSWFFSLVEW